MVGGLGTRGEDRLLTDRDRVDDRDSRGVGRGAGAVRRHSCTTAPRDQYDFAVAGTNKVDAGFKPTRLPSFFAPMSAGSGRLFVAQRVFEGYFSGSDRGPFYFDDTSDISVYDTTTGASITRVMMNGVFGSDAVASTATGQRRP